MPNSAQFAASTSICLARDRVRHRLVDVLGRHVVVHRGDGEIGPADGASGQAEPVEGLGRRDLVDQVQVDVEEVGLALAVPHDVALPHLLGERSGHGLILPGACFTARMSSPGLHMGTAKGRWVVAAAVLGSGVAFLDGTVVNAALPAIAATSTRTSAICSGCSPGTCSRSARSWCSAARSATATAVAGSSRSGWSPSRSRRCCARSRPIPAS